MIDKKDHISLILPVGNVDRNQSIQRRKCRRYWNQLPRCQKNLIILGIIAICITILIFLPGDQVLTKNTKDLTNSHSPQFKNVHQNLNILNKESQNRIQASTDAVAIKSSIQIESLSQLELEVLNKEKNEKLEILDGQEKESVNNSELFRVKIPESFDGPKNERQIAVVKAFKHSWKGYKEFAWGHDNLKPLSKSANEWFGLGLTIVDSLDTIYIMNLNEEFDEARNWVDQYLHFDINRDVNLFEVTIRVLGGLLSAYHLSGDKMFLKKSLDLGNRLIPSFNSPSGIPYSDVNLASMRAHSPKWSPDSSTSEVTTLQLEFRDLSRSTGIPVFEQVVQRVNEKIHELEKTDGLVPIFINPNTGTFRNFATISLGARGDSYYEYLLKQWIQTGRASDDTLIEDYMTAIKGILDHLVKKTPREHLTFVGELINGKDFKPKMDHLTCYLPGTLILGHKFGMPETHLNLAFDLLETCYQTYIKQPTGLAPEITYFNVQESDNESDDDIQVKSSDSHNLLRPEFVESLYYFYAITRNKTYQDMGWKVFQAFEKYTKVENGYISIGNVRSTSNIRPRDMMESFWLGETLKYLYLLFSDRYDEIDLEKYVFNTEAHLLPIRNNVESRT